MEDGLSPGIAIFCRWSKLIDRAAVRHGRTVSSSSLLRCAVKIALLVKDHATRRYRPVCAALEAVQHFLLPFCGCVHCEHKKGQQDYAQPDNQPARPSIVWVHWADSSSKPALAAGERTTLAFAYHTPVCARSRDIPLPTPVCGDA